MFDHLEIRNFKSVEHVELNCRRVNVFIGEPNTGKSNILEALGLLSYVVHFNRSHDLGAYVRFDDVDNLFHEGNSGRLLEITLNRVRPLAGELHVQERVGLRMGFLEGRFRGGVGEEGLILEQGAEPIRSRMKLGSYSILGNRETLSVRLGTETLGIVAGFKFYRFAPTSTYPVKAGGYLLPPYGANLLSVLLRDHELLAEVRNLCESGGLRLSLNADENRIEVSNKFDDTDVSLPYHLTSETFQRLVFHIAALRTNSDSALIFEEPEGSAFTGHARYLGESIAQDDNGNQYFISTRSPSLLLPILEKTLSDDLAVFITYSDGYSTKVRQLGADDLARISDGADVFSNFEMFL
jgi:predicted ATPase